MARDLPTRTMGEPDEQRVARQARGVLRQREVNDSLTSMTHTLCEGSGGAHRDDDVGHVPTADVSSRSMVSGREMLHIERSAKRWTPEDQRCRDRDSMEGRWNRPHDDEPRSGH